MTDQPGFSSYHAPIVDDLQFIAEILLENPNIDKQIQRIQENSRSATHGYILITIAACEFKVEIIMDFLAGVKIFLIDFMLTARCAYIMRIH